MPNYKKIKEKIKKENLILYKLIYNEPLSEIQNCNL
jgi:hypothetical protein